MTVDTAPNTGAEPTPSAPPRWRARRPLDVLVVRWVVLLACIVLAFLPTWVRLAQEASDGAITAYIFVLPLLAVVAAQGVARRRADELPIHDRQTDNIVGGIGLLVSIAIKALWLPRYADQYELAHLDVLAALAFFFGGAILMFGLRPVGRFWSVWLLLLALSPLGYRLVAIGLGGSRLAYAAVMVLLAGIAGAIAVGRTRRRGWLGFVCTALSGFAVAALMLALWPQIDIVWLQLVPTVGAAAVTGVAFYLAARRGRFDERQPRRLAVPTAKWSPSSIVVAIVAAAILALVPLPDRTPVAAPLGPPGPVSTPLAPPVGFGRIDMQQFDWVRAFFGTNATLTRQTMRADEGNSAWDMRSRPRTVVVDVLSTTNRASLAVYPESTLYRLTNTRTSQPLTIDVGRGVTGALYTSVSDALLLTWTKLVFHWQRGDVFQRVTVISVDNHDLDATFPQPMPSMASNLGTAIGTFLRGNAISIDDDPEYKDRELLTTFGTGLVRQQWALANGEPR
ncbi:hypothetical protein [Rhodococcus sp. (in: high G+C Gram-positive bacteria)]|uniref:hypothetical protein n=1 Tax=unclassified Rhodococcus (in: high G+C Gram-positive bacteria) TaxID=192944 RepID=UPI002AD96732|nr:hypothetical protein [Rhodococcus sp. (in: high G+C Gram-positive bacteria)]MDZ7930983.1 hypothetical protein [Rhodococcus sp. (in: high G+C Gram-positive bacteria)]